LLLLNGWTEIHKILYGRFAIGYCSKRGVFNFLHSIIPTLRHLEVVRWNNDDAIAHDPLRMRITFLTNPNLTQLHPNLPLASDNHQYEFHNYRMAGRKFMKFTVGIMP
jgi:hypothetical protein